MTLFVVRMFDGVKYRMFMIFVQRCKNKQTKKKKKAKKKRMLVQLQSFTSRKHAYIILTPLNPTFI